MNGSPLASELIDGAEHPRDVKSVAPGLDHGGELFVLDVLKAIVEVLIEI